MAEYRSGEDIAREYAVGEARLISYAQRGNLPMRVSEGVAMFDISVVSRLFRLRNAPEMQGAVLGALRLGDTLSAPERGAVVAPEPREGKERREPRRTGRFPMLLIDPKKAHVA